MRILLLTFLLFAQRPSVKPAVPAGTVTGRLSTADGGVAAGIRVSAMAAPDSSKTPAEATALVSLTETDSSGRYRLENVPPGRYYIVAGLLESSTYYPGVKSPADAKMVDVTSRATVTGIDFQVARFSTGLTVSGRVVRESNQPLGVAFQVGLGGSDQYFNTTTKFDGSFEFLKVRPGNYTLNVNPVPGGQPRSIVVGDKDVTGIEFIVPWTVDVSGRVLVDGGGPRPNVTVSFVGGPRGYFNAGIGNQTFQITLAEGVYGVVVSGVPAGYYVKSITAGSTDLLSNPIQVSRTATAPQVVVTLGVSTPAPWVKLSGRITGVRNAPGGLSVQLDGPNLAGFNAVVGPDGSFEFPMILPGTYNANVLPTPLRLPPVSIVVPNKDLTGIEIPYPATTELSGRVTVEGGGPLPRFFLNPAFGPAEKSVSPTASPPGLAQLLVTTAPGFTRGPMQVNVNLQPDGTFKTSLPQGQYQIAAMIPMYGSGAASPYFVKSFTYGTTDLVKDPVTVGTEPAEFRITFAPASSNSWSKVSGRVLGMDGARGIVTVSMNAPAFVTTLTTTVNADGTFEFPRVYPGSYTAHVSTLAPSPNLGPAAVNVDVANHDVTGVEIVIPRQREVTGRLQVEGGGPMPRLALPLTAVSAPRPGFGGPGTFVNINPQPDGAFKATLPEGELQVGPPSGLPFGYAVKSLTYGSTDVTRNSLKVSMTDTAELLLTVSTSNRPVKVSGRIAGLDAAMFARGPVQVSLSAPVFVSFLSAVVAADGSFEFPAVFPGNYTARVTGGGISNSRSAPVVVGGADVKGVEIVVPGQKEITGRIVVEGGATIPRIGLRVMTPDDGRGGAWGSILTLNPQAEGTFRITLPEGEHRLDVPQLPPGYTLQSLKYGATDLLRSPLKIAAPDAVEELRVGLVRTGPTPWVTVSGRVIGSAPGARALRVALLPTNAPGIGPATPPLDAPVKDDGSFEFLQVLPGVYSVRVIVSAGAPPPPPRTITVGTTDLTGVEIAFPRQ